MDPARIFWGGASRHFASFLRCFASFLRCFASFCIVSCRFCVVLRRFASFCVVFALFCVNLLCVESNSNTLHCIATTFVVFFCYLDEIYIDLFNICDFFISAHQFCPPLPPPPNGNLGEGQGGGAKLVGGNKKSQILNKSI